MTTTENPVSQATVEQARAALRKIAGLCNLPDQYPLVWHKVVDFG